MRSIFFRMWVCVKLRVKLFGYRLTTSGDGKKYIYSEKREFLPIFPIWFHLKLLVTQHSENHPN